MAEDKLIKTFILAENITCVYRNFRSFSGYKKILITFRIIVEITWTLIAILLFLYEVAKRFMTGNHFLYLMGIYFALNAVSGIAIIICGARLSESDELFLNNYAGVRHEFQNSPVYKKNIKKLKRNLIVFTVILSFASLFDLCFKVAGNIVAWTVNWMQLTFLAIVITNAYIEMRKILHYANITILESALESLTARVTEIREHLSKSQGTEGNFKLTVTQVDEWAGNYQKILISSKLLSECAGSQMFSSLSISSINYVISLYGMLYSVIRNFMIGCMLTGYIMMYSLFCTYTIIFAGQNLLNQSHKMKIEFSKLYNLFSVAYQAPETKSLRNLNLLAQTSPIQIMYTNKLPLGMYLIPTLISLCATYVIVALQFNHII